MTRLPLPTTPTPLARLDIRRPVCVVATVVGLVAAGGQAQAQSAGQYPITANQKATAQQVAQAGVPISELSPNAPDSYTVKRGDTLWGISGLFLRSPWRWPELWGMNMTQIRNPHLIYPGQLLVLERMGDRARLRVGQAVGTDKLSPRVRESQLPADAISTISPHLLEPFLNQAIILSSDELASAPRIVATQEGRVLLNRGDLAYVRGDVQPGNQRIFREPRPLKDPTTQEILGYEATYVGLAEYLRPGEVVGGTSAEVPHTYRILGTKVEAGVGDRLTAPLARDFNNYTPHAPSSPINGQVVSVYGEALIAGQSQIVTINRGQADGVERGHILALWHAGRTVTDKTSGRRETVRLPDERQGLAMVFRVFDRTAYALVLTAKDGVQRGDKFTQP